MEQIAVGIGLMGAAITLVAYGLVSTQRIKSTQAIYPWLNIIGTSGIMFSVFYQWNLAAFIGQICWIAIAIAGLIRIRRTVQRAKTPAHE